MSRLSISFSTIFTCSGGMDWLRMAAAALMPVITSSKSLCLISKPLPRATTGLPNNAVMVALRLTLVFAPVGAASVEALAAAAGVDGNASNNVPSAVKKIILSLIFIFPGFSYQRLQFYHFDVADVSVFLKFFQHRRRRRAVEVQDRQREPARSVARQAHVGNIHFMFSQQRAEITDDARPVLVVEKQQGAAGRYLHRRAVKPHNARVVGGTEKGSTRRD